MELDEILDEVCVITARLMRARVCSIYLFDAQRRNLVLRATHGLNREIIGKSGLAAGQGVQGWAAERNQLVALEDCTSDPRYLRLDGSGEEPFASLLCSPLRIQDEVIGVMTARRERGQRWSEDEITLYETVCKQVAIVIEKSRLYFGKVQADRLAAIGISLSEVAHYIKNILQGMSGGQFFVDSGLKRGDLERARHGWEMLQRNIQKISALVQNMLNYSRSAALHFELTDLNAILQELAAEYEATAAQRGAAFRVSLDDTIPEMPLAADSLHEAFQNLLSNALDALVPDRPGEIELTSRLDLAAGVARVTVRDNGSGIAPEHGERIFHLFYSTKGRGGTGIGLAVTRKIIEEHGGRIEFISEPGQGTTFTVLLPLERRVTPPIF